jgi:hypothetical protein
MATRPAWWCLAALVTAACSSTPDLLYQGSEAGSDADGGVPPDVDAEAADAPSPVDAQGTPESGANDSGTTTDASDGGGKKDAAPDASKDASTDTGTDGGWTNTCPGTVPPGATRCDGNTACFERNAGDCASAASDCMQQCGTTKICCVNNGGNVTCKSDPSQCP